MNLRLRVVVVFFAAVCLVPALWGQVETGSIVGTVTDPSGAAIPNATLVLTETQKNIKWTGSSNASGNYVFPDLLQGVYAVQAAHPGFKTTTQSGLELDVNQTIRANITLPLGAAQQTVDVTSAPPPIQTDTADIGKQISAVAVHSLPMGGTRNFQQLFELLPGVADIGRQHSDFFNPQASLDMHVNGQPNVVDNLMIEGVSDNERTRLLQIYIPPADAIQEVSVATSNYDTEQGAAGGYVANVILKSGTNQLHGDAYEFLRPDNYGSANPYCMVRNTQTCPSGYPPNHFNQFGGSIGGPIIRNKLFFFGDWESTRDHSTGFHQVTVPDAKFRAGDFSEALDPTLANTSFKGTLLPDIVYDPSTGDSQGQNRTAFAGNIIPQSVLQANPAWPIVQKLMALWPMPNQPGLQNNYQVNTQSIRDNNQFDVKIDGQPRERDNFSYRFSWMNPHTTETGYFGDAGGDGNFYANGTDITYQSSVEWTHTFGPNVINELRLGLSRYRNVANPIDYGKNTADDLGIKGINIQPFDSGLPTINVHGGTTGLGFSASLPWIRTETDFDAVDNWTFINGNHTFKFGVDATRLRDDLLQDQTFGPRGRYDFCAAEAGLQEKNKSAADYPEAQVSQGGIANGFAALLLDRPCTVGRDLPVIFPALRQLQFASYFTDKWQVNPKLTVNLGIRDELYEPLKPHFAGGLSNYDPNTNSLLIAGYGNVPLGLGLKTHFGNIDPRIGLAYRVTDTSVVRAAFGMSTIPFYDNGYAFNYPVRQNNGYPSANSFVPAADPATGLPVNFATGMPAPSPAVIPANGIIPVTKASGLQSQSFEAVPTNMHEAYLEMWNLAYARQLPGNFTLDAAYVGNRAVDILYHRNINYGLTPIFAGGTVKNGCGNSASCLNLGSIFGVTGGVDQFTPMSNSYNALQLKVDHRFNRGLMSSTSFTWSKTLDFGDGTDMPGLGDNVNFSRDYGPADFDRRLALTEGFVYQLPFGSYGPWAKTGVASAILGGWQLNGVMQMMSGMPFSIGSSSRLDWNGVNQRGNIDGPFKVLGGIGYGNQWFDPSSFSDPTPDTYGNAGRNTFYGPGYFNLDASLFRNFQISERTNLRLRIETFNTTNTPGFDNPNSGNIDSSDFGQVTGESKGTRSLQFGLQLSF
ncbi:MAG: carboxypeptidase regulatory-like domain-containing protein [Terriglobales bacterium]